jgi:hypothetical protein
LRKLSVDTVFSNSDLLFGLSLGVYFFVVKTFTVEPEGLAVAVAAEVKGGLAVPSFAGLPNMVLEEFPGRGIPVNPPF